MGSVPVQIPACELQKLMHVKSTRLFHCEYLELYKLVLNLTNARGRAETGPGTFA